MGLRHRLRRANRSDSSLQRLSNFVCSCIRLLLVYFADVALFLLLYSVEKADDYKRKIKMSESFKQWCW